MSEVKEVFDKMPEAFKPDAASGVDAVFQYEISGDGGGSWNITVKDSKCEIKEGKHQSPSVTMNMDAPTFLAIQKKELNGMQAYMSGKLKVTGNIMLAQTFAKLFGA